MGKFDHPNIQKFANEISIREYSSKFRKEWDKFISESKNGTFLFYRNYMEYHSDRFEDHSLMFFYKNTLVGVMPANIEKDKIYSHAGLTYGGVVSGNKMRTPVMMGLFKALTSYLEDMGITKLVYKPVPHIYHIIPAEEDLYALFRFGARLIRRDVSSTIDLTEKIRFSSGRRRSIKNAKSHGLVIKQTDDFDTYMSIVEENLRKKYGVKPTHTADEIKLLASRFPEHIKLFAVYYKGEMVAGVIMYESNKKVAHAQYIASNEIGKELYALDYLFDYLINEYYSRINPRKYFDFGISTENEGKYLNFDLITYKEQFGARATVYDRYELKIGDEI
ncbi:GNAT family N-acetyltransferase [Thermococcus sibiricus]|uniref:BioF2-like acetyltransferase domain-containing protein n=1 Tax=Thermococcus sibiricus (strain DSM 12597 / MM 739) TaxID=604354 RepID=C6A0B8_THESM|nr:GNAT family N-acetyltransferase [Thermococcus sibiricus]ACS91099.1 hypothetical protein TSIB_2052 [Thermococcus sibiricus MM 739]